MILQSLNDLYNRLSEDPEKGLPKPGYSLQNITFRVIIKRDGSCVDIEDARQEIIELTKSGRERKNLRSISLLVPGQGKPPGSGLNPCFLWDNAAYMLGYRNEDPNPERTEASFEAFKKRHLDLEESVNDPDFSAVCRFLEKWNPEEAVNYPDLLEVGSGFGLFQISGETSYVHQSPGIDRWWKEEIEESATGEDGFCLVTGKREPVAILHDPPIKGVMGAQSMGAKLVSFNFKSTESFRKEQGSNSPVGESAAFGYCNALNYLLAERSRRFRLGDATTVFWTDQPTPAEELLPFMMAGIPEAEDDRVKARLQKILEKISRGTLANDDLGNAEVRYYILGLSPNAARLSVRFWLTGTLGELTANLRKHFQDIQIVRTWDETNSKKPEPIAPTAYQLLRQSSRDADGIPPLLAGSLMRAILLGSRYPDSLINAVMNRIRVVEKNPKGEGTMDNVNYFRASILKGWLVRNHHQSISTMLDETNTNTGYRLGRLFAALEKTQQDALPGINATIRERFYSSASATPRAVFGRLLRTYPHHLAKLEPGAKVNRERLIQEILTAVNDFPAHMNLQNQAQFALGYYHQRKDFFTKKEPSVAET